PGSGPACRRVRAGDGSGGALRMRAQKSNNICPNSAIFMYNKEELSWYDGDIKYKRVLFPAERRRK
ncbi:MAG: hypothetical protein IKF75_04535, partial [Lachnospiraceae bacterium]|nr:hypothetical protein [Lachnospiraceae bacterium]